MFIRGLDFNRAAERFAVRHGKPIVGNCDVHRLVQLGSTYSLVDAERDPDAICEAIGEGRVRVESRPITWALAARVMLALAFADHRRMVSTGKSAGSISTTTALSKVCSSRDTSGPGLQAELRGTT